MMLYRCLAACAGSMPERTAVNNIPAPFRRTLLYRCIPERSSNGAAWPCPILCLACLGRGIENFKSQQSTFATPVYERDGASDQNRFRMTRSLAIQISRESSMALCPCVHAFALAASNTKHPHYPRAQRHAPGPFITHSLRNLSRISGQICSMESAWNQVPAARTSSP